MGRFLMKTAQLKLQSSYGIYLRLFHTCDVMVLYWTVFTSHKSAKGPLLLSKHWTCSPLHPLCRMWPSKRFQDFQTSLFGNSGVVGGTDGQMDGQTDRRTDRQTQRLVEAPSRSLKTTVSCTSKNSIFVV